VSVNFEIADVHRWNYPEAEFDVVVEIFTQFSSPNERRAKWIGMRQTLKPGGLLILQGYTPKQLEYATGGPKQIQNLSSAVDELRSIKLLQSHRESNEIILSEGQVNIFNFTKNVSTSVEQIERFYARNFPLSREMTINLQSFGSD
jgi:hypothetical protein